MYVTALNNLGRLLEVTGQIPESLDYLERALAMAPSNHSVRLNLANSYLQGGHPEKSLEILKTLALDSPELSLAHNSLGVATHVIGDQSQSILHFRDAIKCNPDFAEAHENLAQALLFEEDYDEAWVEYEWRWQNDSNTQTKFKFEEPAWNGESLSGKTLLVHAEQGFGDVIQFARFLSLIEKHDSQLILACHSALIELLSQLKCVDQVVDFNRELIGIQLPFDYQAPLLSLPRILGVDGTNIPDVPYLSAESAPLDGDSGLYKIGFAWAGRPRHEYDPHRNRSCPIFGFEALLNISNTQFYSLQTGPNSDELENFDEFGSIINLEPQINSFIDTARLISGLDLVITVDTALAHLTGAMGKPVLILLATCADWRWQSKVENNDNNLWYPSARVFRQISPGEWSDPLHDVELYIRDLIL